MQTFLYEASDASGRIKKGVISADSSKQARQQLRDQSLIPIVLEIQDSTDTKTKKRAKSKLKLSASNVVLITRQMSVLINSGLTIEETLNAIAKQAESTKMKTVMTGILGYVMEGQSLTQALGYYPKIFSELYTASVAAGEQTGRLNTVMERLADFMEARQSISQNISGALVYPIAMIVICLAIVWGLMVFIVPQVVSTYEGAGQALPALTLFVIGVSNFLTDYGGMLLIGMAVLFLALRAFFSQTGPKLWLHTLFLKTPILRHLSKGMNSARMSRTLAIMVSSGVPLITALKSSAQVLTNHKMRNALIDVAGDVSEGVSLSKSLDRTASFPPLLVQMVASGESSGTLDVMLEKSANVTERELKTRIDAAISLFQPLMIVLMGGLVFLIVMAILLPILNFNQFLG